jgi:hypothetical protein
VRRFAICLLLSTVVALVLPGAAGLEPLDFFGLAAELALILLGAFALYAAVLVVERLRAGRLMVPAVTDPAKGKPERINLVVSGLEPADATRLRELLGDLTVYDPTVRLREFRPYLTAPGKVAELQVETERAGKVLLEEVDAALFAYGYGQMYGVQTWYAMREALGGDAVMVEHDGTELTGPPTRVQVKGIRDQAVSGATINEEIAKLGKWDYSSVIVVVALHMSLARPLEGLVIPPGLRVGALYVLTAADDRLERWQLAGDLMQERAGFEEFLYP